MVIVSLKGGLGNQLFQYAVARNISLINQIQLKMDIYQLNNSDYISRDFAIKKFNISADLADLSEVRKFHNGKYSEFLMKKLYKKNIKFSNKIFEKEEFRFDKNILSIPAGYLEGYWQSFKYFHSIREVLLKEFSLADEMDFDNKSVCHRINSTNSVSIHIRRGDYFSNPKNLKIYNVFGLEYYANAINLISEKITSPSFFVFSDDLEWAADNLKLDNATFVNINSFEKPEKDLILMSKCKHNIIANSTFSWWAAWLNVNTDKIVVAPKKWMSTVNNLDDLYPDDWIRI